IFFSSRRRHTRSKRDWSSDVCSSDLNQSICQIFSEYIVDLYFKSLLLQGYFQNVLAPIHVQADYSWQLHLYEQRYRIIYYTLLSPYVISIYPYIQQLNGLRLCLFREALILNSYQQMHSILFFQSKTHSHRLGAFRIMFLVLRITPFPVYLNYYGGDQLLSRGLKCHFPRVR